MIQHWRIAPRDRVRDEAHIEFGTGTVAAVGESIITVDYSNLTDLNPMHYTANPDGTHPYLSYITGSGSEVTDPINPSHYQQVPGIECIDVTQHFDFLTGNAIKYLWRHKNKNGIEDLKKARWYVERLIKEWKE